MRDPALPVLRKDFVVDEYQVLEAVLHGATAILLIVAALSDEQLGRLIGFAERYGLAALVEVHEGDELERALAAGATCVGVNNRSLKTLEVSLDTAFRLVGPHSGRRAWPSPRAACGPERIWRVSVRLATMRSSSANGS